MQELPLSALVQSVTKYAALIDHPQAVPVSTGASPLHCATSGRPGPVWLEVPLDVQGAVIEPELLGRVLTTPNATRRDA